MTWYIRNYEARMAQAEDKQKAILRFLRDERWTTYQVLSLFLDLSIQTVRRTITKMVKMNLVSVNQVEFGFGRGMNVIGLSPNGLSAAFDGEDRVTAPFYSLSKVNPLTMRHKIAIQENRIVAEQAGWTDWTPESAFKEQPEWQSISDKKKKRISIPDALATDTQGNRVAIEIERTAKDPKRYPEILAFHLLSIKREKRYDRVLYLMPDETMQRRIEKLFLGVKEVYIDGKKMSIQDGHLSNLKFSTYGDFQ